MWGLLISVRAIFWLRGDLTDDHEAVGVAIHVLAALIGIGLLAYGLRARLRAQRSEVGSPSGRQVAAHD